MEEEKVTGEELGEEVVNEDDIVQPDQLEGQLEEIEEEEEVVVELPEQEEDDEELASLTPEEAEAYKQAQSAKQREIEEKGKELLTLANELFAEGKLEEAQEAYESAEEYLGAEPEVIIGILRCGTKDFTSVENVGKLREALDELRVAEIEVREEVIATHGEAIHATLDSIRAEKDPLEEKVLSKRAERAEKFAVGYKKATKNLAISGIVSFAMFALTTSFFANIYHQAGQGFLITSIVTGVLFLVSLGFTLVYANKFQTARNRVEMNKDNMYSNDGRRLNVLTEQEEFYSDLASLINNESV